MSLLLNVPFAEKDEAKAFGAKWNAEIKKWYAPDRNAYPKLIKWIDGAQIVYDHIYITEGIHTCFRCKKPTSVVGFAFETYCEIGEDHMEFVDNCIHIGHIISQIPPKLADELREQFGYYWGYSNTTHSSDYGNHCQHCGVLQGNWFIFDEVDSPFFVDGKQSAEKLILHKIKLPQDIAVTAEIGYGSEDYCIKRFAKIIDSDLRWD